MARLVDSSSAVFDIYRTRLGLDFRASERLVGYKAQLDKRPVGLVGCTTPDADLRLRVEISHFLTGLQAQQGLSVALRRTWPPHGLYRYTPAGGAPARIVAYAESRVTLVVAGGGGSRVMADADPADLVRADSDEQPGWPTAALIALFGALGGTAQAAQFAVFCDPLGFLYYGA